MQEGRLKSAQKGLTCLFFKFKKTERLKLLFLSSDTNDSHTWIE